MGTEEYTFVIVTLDQAIFLEREFREQSAGCGCWITESKGFAFNRVEIGDTGFGITD